MSDNSLEIEELKKILISNIPYFLTVELIFHVLKFKFTYIDEVDKRNFIDKSTGMYMEYSPTTGRIYSLDLPSDNWYVDSKSWNLYYNTISNLELAQSSKDELKLFFKILKCCNESFKIVQ